MIIWTQVFEALRKVVSTSTTLLYLHSMKQRGKRDSVLISVLLEGELTNFPACRTPDHKHCVLDQTLIPTDNDSESPARIMPRDHVFPELNTNYLT